ncbi:ATP synthase subunit I [Thalassotalea litorea]|uniref:ATP synthase subunit I n=1 Tax=Thalassotalea litorea TaxID=2020715 RepID=UPI0037371083
MQNTLAKPGRKYAYRQVFLQFLITLLSFTICYFGWGLTAATSAFAGGMVSVIPNFVFAHKAFKFAGARAARQVVDSFYGGVKLKLVLTAILFALCFKFLELNVVTFFITYSITMLVPWLNAIVNRFHFNQQKLG